MIVGKFSIRVTASFFNPRNLVKFIWRHLYLLLALGLLVMAGTLTDKNIHSFPLRIGWVGYGGYCTDWAYARWHEVYPNEELKVDGDAWQWLGYAVNHGMTTGSTPRTG